RSFAADARDLPFTLTYLFDGDGTVARLAAQTGVPADWRGAAAMLDVDGDAPWPLRAVLETARPIEVALEGDAWPSGPWTSAPARAFAVPIAQQGQARPAGVFIAGINPHRLFDVAYRGFVTLVVGQLAAVLANVNAYEDQRQRAESLAELDRAKTVFFSNVSHELRTPLTLMLGPLEGLLADPDLAGGTRAELATIHRNGLRLLKLVNTLLDFARIEAGRATAQFVATDLAQLTSDLASVFRAATDRAGLRLTVACPTLDVAVRVDRDMWEKIVLNLVSNAFKFTLAGEITVALVRRGDHVELGVRDTGSGIPADELPRVFERFHRVAGTAGRTHEGTGIGLALVHELVRLHGGTIRVASELGRGTTFTVSIPLGAGAGATVEAVAELRPAATAFVEEALRWLPDGSQPALRVPAAEDARARLLIADDNADMRDYLRRLLADRWQVETVADGHAALAAIRARRPDLVISDVMMPRLDGLGLVAELRADPALRELPVIMLSARAGEEARIEGLQAGATEYLAKPFAARELRAQIETQLLRAAMRAAEAHHARRIATVFEQAPIAIAMLRGPDHVFEVANPSYRAIVGGRDVIGQTVAAALPEIVAQGFIDVLDRVYQTNVAFVGSSYPARLRRPPPDGVLEDRFFDLIYQPLVDAEGAVTGIAVVAHDVTALATARRAAETANRAKDEFLAMLGHELRNPLAPITTALELMRMRPEVGAARERAVIERQVQHLVSLVDDLLDISRITRGKVELRPEPVELAGVVARALEVVSPLLEARQHVVAIDVPAGLVVHGDPARLAQVLSNLVNNAAKYTPKAGHIAVRAARDGDHVALAVVDTGIGIEPAMLGRIFEPFTQDPQSIERSQGGLGLGLAIVDNLVKLHGGTVTAHSAGRGHGSELTVRLPLIDPPVVAAAPVATPDAAAGEARILIIDDNVDAALLLAEVLAAGGYHTLAVHDGPSALHAAEAFHPQLAVVDLGLPVMDGFELARHLRERPDP
ncbi:MAG: ATP-binding protein, partial [Kofleriaceae bacterium]